MYTSKYINHLEITNTFKLCFSLITSFYYLMFTNPKNYFLILSVLSSSKFPISLYINKLNFISTHPKYSNLYTIENIPYITIAIYTHQIKINQNLKLKENALNLFNWSKEFSQRFKN
jgi:hypothetical protein